MTGNHGRKSHPSFWHVLPELPPEVFGAWRKSDRAISPVAVVATVDPNGSPRAVPFGSLCAVTPNMLRLISNRGHKTFANLCRGGQVTVVMISPPDISVSVRGQARVVKERMDHDQDFAIVDIDIQEVKNDMAYQIVLDSGITIHAKDQFKPWYEAAMAELSFMV